MTKSLFERMSEVARQAREQGRGIDITERGIVAAPPISVTRQRYLTARHIDGLSVEDAAFEAGISLDEAKLHDAAVASGEVSVPQPAPEASEPEPDLPPVLPLRAARARLGIPEDEAEPRAHRLLDAITPPPEAAPVHQEEKTMARRAKTKKYDVEEVLKPDFTRAVSIYRNDIRPAAGAVGEHAQEMSTAYKEIKKGCHIHPGAAKAAFKLYEMEPNKRDDYLRGLYGLMQALKIGISADLVDQMDDDEAPRMPVADRPALELIN